MMAVFDAYADHAAFAYEHGFRGCGLLNAALLPGRPEEARAMAERLPFLLEGAMARAGLEGPGTRLEHARALAADLLDRL